MLRVQSLTLRIVLQFAVILLPLLALLIYQGARDTQRTQAMSRSGAEVAAATGVHSDVSRTQAMLDQARTMAAVQAQALPLLRRATSTLHAFGTDATVAAPRALQALTVELTDGLSAGSTALPMARELAGRAVIEADLFLQTAQRGLQSVVDNAVVDAQRANEQLTILAILMGVVTLMFIAQMLRDLSQPLKTAVEVANRIADGQHLDAIEIDTQKDLGNLLSSLKRMHQSLMRFETDVASERAKLQTKVTELAESERGLAQAQQTAKLGSWAWHQGQAQAHWSGGVFAVWGLPLAEHAPSLRELLRMMSPHARHEFLLHLRELRAQATSVDFEHPLTDTHGAERRLHHRWSSEFDAQGALVRASGTVQDVTERHRAAEEIRRLAMYDSLTGLANRSLVQRGMSLEPGAGFH